MLCLEASSMGKSLCVEYVIQHPTVVWLLHVTDLFTAECCGNC